MKERGILFSAPMVRALLAGAKTQTRRAVRNDAAVTDICGGGVEPVVWWPRDALNRDAACPYGVPGDRLWVRETWAVNHAHDKVKPSLLRPTVSRIFAASELLPGVARDGSRGRWRPGMFMPRWASRITLKVTEVRVQRLQDISEKDAKAEGSLFAIDEEQTVLYPHLTAERNKGCVACRGRRNGIPGLCHDSLRGDGRPFACWYAKVWDSINGDGSWASNPWAWAISFKRVGQ